MPRPTTKQDIKSAASEQFEKLWDLINSMTDVEQNMAFTFDYSGKKEAHWTRDKNIRDILVHLHEWHKLLLNWVSSNRSGKEVPFLPPPYNWKSYGDMNIEIWNNHQATPYDKSKDLIKQSHAEVIALLDEFSNDELFIKKAFSWIGGSTLGSYFISVTSSHYDWAVKKLKLQIKTIK